MDTISFNRLMPLISFCLSAVLFSIFFIGQQSFVGIIACIWLLFGLSLANFSTIPAQAFKLFPGNFSNVVIGGIGLAESFGFICGTLINKVII